MHAIEMSREAAFASHRLVGWIYWDPVAIANYADLGVPDGLGYYVASRAAPLANGGDAVVTAALGSIHADFVSVSLDLCRRHTTFAAAAGARDAAVVEGLRRHVPDICDPLASMAEPLWEAADSLPSAGRVLFAAHRAWPRPDDDLLSAWLAVNCIREWRGDSHWALQVAEGLDGVQAGILDGAWRSYVEDWLPRSRGADDSALDIAYRDLADRGLAEGHVVNDAGVAYRQELEDRLDRWTAAPWQHLGDARCRRFLELMEPAGSVLVSRIDDTAGTNWMPAARRREGGRR